MRLFKRHTNPIFVEEEQYNWQEKRGGARLLMVVLVLSVLALGVAAFII